MFDLGDVVPLTVDIRDANGVLAAAGAVTLTITLPDDTTVTPSVVTPSIGRYQFDYVAPQAGRYVVRWLATGVNASAHVDTFEVLPPPPSPPWPPLLEDLKADLNISASDTRDDANLATDLAAARAVVERELAGDFDFAGTNALLPSPSADVLKGTVRLAGRFNARRRSPDGLVDSGDFGTSRIPRFDADIERMLGVGPYRRPMI